MIKTDLPQAKLYLEQASMINPNSPSIMDTRGLILLEEGDYRGALTQFRSAFTLDSKQPAIQYHIALALHKLNRNSEAKMQLQNVLSAFGDFPQKAQATKLFNQL